MFTLQVVNVDIKSILQCRTWWNIAMLLPWRIHSIRLSTQPATQTAYNCHNRHSRSPYKWQYNNIPTFTLAHHCFTKHKFLIHNVHKITIIWKQTLTKSDSMAMHGNKKFTYLLTYLRCSIFHLLQNIFFCLVENCNFTFINVHILMPGCLLCSC